MLMRWTTVLLWLVLIGCGGGSGGGGNEERVIALLPVSYSFSFPASTDPLPFCFGPIPCNQLGVMDQIGVALSLAMIDENTTPGTQAVVDAGADVLFPVFVDLLTNDTLNPIAAALLVNGQAPGCIGDDESDLVLQESRPVPGVDLVGFEITGVALAIDSVSKTTTQVSLTGRVLIFGRTAATP